MPASGWTNREKLRINHWRHSVSGPSFETTPPEYKADALIPALINLRNLYSSVSFMCFQSPLLKLQIPACRKTNGFCKKKIPLNKQQLRSGRFGVSRNLRKSELSAHVVTYIGLCKYQRVQLKSPSTHWKTIGSSMTAPPPSMSPISILPQRSSHCTLIPQRKKPGRI